MYEVLLNNSLINTKGTGFGNSPPGTTSRQLSAIRYYIKILKIGKYIPQ